MKGSGRGDIPLTVALGHTSAEVGELAGLPWRTGMVGAKSEIVRGVTEGERGIELIQHLHLAVVKRFGSGPQAIGPTKTSSELFYAKVSELLDSGLQTMIFEMEPLADAEFGSELGEVGGRQLG